jgi:hypothetical protein
VVLFRNFGQTHPPTAVGNNRNSVDVERRSTNSSSFHFRSPHTGANALDDKTFFKLGNRTDNNDYRPAQWASRVNIFAQTNELDAEMGQLVEYFQEMANASRHSIEGSNEDDVEAMAPGIC